MPGLDLGVVLTGQGQGRLHRVADLAAVEVFVGPFFSGVLCEDASVVFGEVLEVSDEMVPDLSPVIDG